MQFRYEATSEDFLTYVELEWAHDAEGIRQIVRAQRIVAMYWGGAGVLLAALVFFSIADEFRLEEHALSMLIALGLVLVGVRVQIRPRRGPDGSETRRSTARKTATALIDSGAADRSLGPSVLTVDASTGRLERLNETTGVSIAAPLDRVGVLRLFPARIALASDGRPLLVVPRSAFASPEEEQAFLSTLRGPSPGLAASAPRSVRALN